MFVESVAALFEQLMYPQYQIASMFLTSLVLALILYKPLTEFHATDPKPNIIPYMPKKQAAGLESAVEVQVGMYILNFPIFDLITNQFTADITLWFEFDPSLLPLETIQKFSFDRGTIVSKSEPDMKIMANKLFVQYTIRLQFSTDLNHKLFPFNDHRIFITLKNEYVSPRELIFNASRSSFLIAPNAHTADWTIADRSTETGYFEAQLDTFDKEKIIHYPAVIFSIDLAKSGVRKIFIIMLPMLMLFFISLLTLSLDPKVQSRSILTLSTGTLTGLIAYRFVIEKIVPDVGYFTRADHLFNIFLTIIFIIFTVNIFVVNRGVNDVVVLLVKGFVFLLIEFMLIMGTYFMRSKA